MTCAYCGGTLRNFILRCTVCGRDCHDGNCMTYHYAICDWHHRKVCGPDCPFCMAGKITRREAIGE